MLRSGTLAAALLLVLSLATGTPVGAASGVWPVPGSVVRGFDPPEQAWASGHRGVDLAATADALVVAPAAGRVTFAGQVAGRAVVVVTHGALRSTFEPVDALIAVGQEVAAGEVIGRLRPGHTPCPVEACLHWGLIEGEEYRDPLGLVGSAPRLLPDSALAGIRERATAREEAARGSGETFVGSAGVLTLPTAGRLTSGFGPRFHPIFHEWRQHQGIDLSAACGTPIRAAADGVVSHRGHDASGGWRLVLDHGTVAGVALQTVYLHAEGYRVSPGQRVAAGEVVGTVGATGWATGCHLHFSVKVNQRHVDPLAWL